MGIWVATVLAGGCFNEIPYVMSRGTIGCVVTGAGLLLGLWLFGRRFEERAGGERTGSYPLRKAQYIKRYMAHLGHEVVIEEMEAPPAK